MIDGHRLSWHESLTCNWSQFRCNIVSTRKNAGTFKNKHLVIYTSVSRYDVMAKYTVCCIAVHMSHWHDVLLFGFVSVWVWGAGQPQWSIGGAGYACEGTVTEFRMFWGSLFNSRHPGHQRVLSLRWGLRSGCWHRFWGAFSVRLVLNLFW